MSWSLFGGCFVCLCLVPRHQTKSQLSFPMRPGDKLVLPAGTVHEAYTATGCTYIISNRYDQ